MQLNLGTELNQMNKVFNLPLMRVHLALNFNLMPLGTGTRCSGFNQAETRRARRPPVPSMPTMSRTRTRDPAAGAHDSVIGPVSDGDKAGATLLFSGIFLSLVGVTFTAMVWIDFPARFEWTQLLGPILLSVGGTFALISVCKFRIVSCLPPPGPPSVLGDIDQPVRLPRAAVARCLPPPCASVTHDVSAPPQHYGRWTGDQALECVCPPAYADLFPD